MEESRWRVFREASDTVRAILAPALPLEHLLGRGAHLRRVLGERRAKRPRQAQRMAEALGALG